MSSADICFFFRATPSSRLRGRTTVRCAPTPTCPSTVTTISFTSPRVRPVCIIVSFCALGCAIQRMFFLLFLFLILYILCFLCFVFCCFFLCSSTRTGDKCPCEATRVDGTSASSPAFAAMVTLLNDALLNANKPVLGFLNPLLYQVRGHFISNMCISVCMLSSVIEFSC